MTDQSDFIFIIPNNEIGGAQNFFKRLYQNIPLEKKYLYIENKNSSDRLSLLHRVFNIHKLIKRSNGRVIIFATVNSMIPCALCKFLPSKFFLVSRLGNTLSSELSLKLFLVHKIVFLLSDLVVFQSNSMKKDALKVLNIQDSEKYLVINNGIDFDELSSKSSQDDMTVIDDNFTNFILVGSFKRQKAYDIFLEAILLLPELTLRQMRFYICGHNAFGENLFEKFQNDISDSNLLDTVLLLGWKENPYPLMKKMDAYILPSRYEGFPNSLIEALSLGLPSIASRSPGANEEIIITDFNGITFENENPLDLSHQILNMDKQIKEFKSSEIINDVRERFDIKKIADKYVKAIK